MTISQDTDPAQTTKSVIEAEMAVLGSVMLAPEKIAEVREVLRPEDFHHRKYGAVWKEICAMDSEGIPADIRALNLRLEHNGVLAEIGGTGGLSELMDFAFSPTNARNYAVTIRDEADRRRVIDLCNRIREIAVDGDFRRAKEALADGLSGIGFTKGVKTLKQVAQESFEDKRGTVIEFGYPRLDRAFGGGVSGTSMTVVAAGPSIGKTQFALNLARTMRHEGKPARALIISLEMNEEELFDRLSAMGSEIPIGVCRAMRLRKASGETVERNIKTYQPAVKAAAMLPHLIYNAGSLTPTELQSAVAANIKNIDCVILDYLQLMSADNPKDNDYARISRASRACKNLARQYKIPFIVLAQLSRDGSKCDDSGVPAEPFLHQLRDSGQIEQDADNVIMLWRRKEKNVCVEELSVLIRKNRQGALGSMTFSMRLSSGLIEDLSEQQMTKEDEF